MSDGQLIQCAMCKKPAKGTMVVLESATKEKVHVHEVCMLRAQVLQLTEDKALAERLVAGLVARAGGEVRVTREDFERAKKHHNDVLMKPDAQGWIDLKLKGLSLIITSTMPPTPPVFGKQG